VGYVGTSHVARDQHSIGIMRADGGIEHGPPATWPNDVETAWPFGQSTGQRHYDRNTEKNKITESHWRLPDMPQWF
jgi:hypothetical protein